MVEIIVAIMIFGIMLTGITITMSTSLNMVRNNRNRSVAANLASQEMETVRAMASTDFTKVANAASPLVQFVDVGTPKVRYTVTRQTEWVLESATNGACDVDPGRASGRPTSGSTSR